MNSRDQILKAIDQNKPAFVKAPEMPVSSEMGRETLLAQFIQTVELIGAEVLQVRGWETIKKEFEHQVSADRFVVNAIPELGMIDSSIHERSIPAELEKIDRSFVCGQLAVAENGAIWVDDSNLPNRLLPFICQHLTLVIEAKNIVGNMHQAYETLNTFKTGWGAFIAGPSKTADIEQSLVIGAHGARSLRVYIIL